MTEHEELIASSGMQKIGREWIDPAFRARFGYPDSIGAAGEKILDLSITPDELLDALTTINRILDETLGAEE